MTSSLGIGLNIPTRHPYAARELSPREQTKLDTYHYLSPRNDGRRVMVVEPCRLALALELEFDPSVVAFVERPRTLVVDGRELELCFWVSRRDGAESFLAFRRQAKPTVPAVQAEERLCNRLLDAARNAALNLTIRKPQSLMRMRVANATRLELLPYVQSAADIKGIDVLVEAVRLHISAYPSSSFHGIETSLARFDWRDVRCVTCLLIHQGYLTVNFNEKLTVSTQVRLREDP